LQPISCATCIILACTKKERFYATNLAATNRAVLRAQQANAEKTGDTKRKRREREENEADGKEKWEVKRSV